MYTKRKTPVFRHRPVTSRGTKNSSNNLNVADFLPKRPVTAHPHLLAPNDKGIDAVRVRIEPVELTDTRAICEAAAHERDQVKYGDPLHGQSVEPRNIEMATRSCFSVANAVSLHESLRVRAFQARAQGDYAKAIKYYSKVIEIAPEDQLSLFQLALAYEKTGDLHQARSTYKKVISFEEDNCFAHFNIGNILMRQNKATDAIKYYTRAIDKCKPNDRHRLLFFRQRGAAYRKSGDYEKASRDYAHYHAKCGHLVKQNDRPWDLDTSTNDAESSVDVDIEYRANVNEPRALKRPGKSQVVYNSESLYAVPESSSLKETEIPFDTCSRHRVFQIANAAPASRTQDELLFLMDAMQKVFPFCSSLRPEACTLLCSKLVGTANLDAGTPLFVEKSKGSHVFFVYRGRVSTLKTVVQQFGQISPDKEKLDGADADEIESSQSWESHFSTADHNDSNGEDTFRSAVHQISGIASRWTKRQMKLCQFGHGSVFGFQGRHSGDLR